MADYEKKTDLIEEPTSTAPVQRGMSTEMAAQIDLNQNISAKIRNPLLGIPRSELLQDVRQFAQQHQLEDILPNLEKGALAAQNPDSFDRLDILTEDEKETLRYEKAHKWSHPKWLYATIIICSIGAATQGWDQTGSNGANLGFPQEFGIPDVPGPNQEYNQWIIGIVNAGPYLGSVGLGVWLADPLNNWFGRRFTIFLTALVLIATPIASGFTHSWQTLFVVRLIMGFGMGAKGVTVPIYAAENSPAAIRGALVMSWQLWTAFGIFIGLCANLIVVNTGDIAWRLQLGSAFIPALPLAIGILFLPESPRWLMKKGRYAQAYQSLKKLRNTELLAARDLYFIAACLREEAKIQRADSFIRRILELVTIPRCRRALYASQMVMLAQQMCGINIIAFYSSTVFVQSGFSPIDALKASIGFGAINFLFAFPAVWTIDTFGRRALVLFTFPNMAWTLLVAGMCLFVDDGVWDGATNVGPNPNSKLRLGLVATFIYIFAMFYSPGEGPVPFAYSAEVFPLAQRELGMAAAVATCLGFAAVLSITFPRIAGAFTLPGAFGFYCGLNILAFIGLFFLLPETKQLTLEELDQVFSVPTSVFIKHNVTKEIPYFFKRWILFRKNTPKPKLYSFQQDSANEDTDFSEKKGASAVQHKENVV